MTNAVVADTALNVARRSDAAPPASIRVLHVLEATLGGTRRILAESVTATLDSPIAQGLVYGTSRADDGFAELLTAVHRSGWYLAPVDTLRRPVSVTHDSLSVAHVRRAISDFRPNILHVRSAKAGAIGRIAAATFGKRRPRVVYSPHALPIRLGRWYMSAERALAPFTDRFIADSDSERHEMMDHGLGGGTNVDVVYPAIDSAHYSPRDKRAARRELGLPEFAPIVIGIGRMCFQKDPQSFVEAIAKLRQVVPDLLAIWIGDGELRAEAEAAALRLNLGKSFVVTGWLNDVRPHIAASDVLLSTSRYESLGLFVAECFAMERPVVASRITGTVDVFDSIAKPFLYPEGELDVAVKLLAQLLESPALQARVGKAGRLSMVERFSHYAMGKALHSSYEKALAR